MTAGDVVECSSTVTQYPDITQTATTSDINEELRQFAQQFRVRRLRLGATQADVGAGLASLRSTSTPLSQSTVCRFESMTLSCSNMQSLRPALEAWLTDAESRCSTDMGDSDRQGQTSWTAATVRRRRRTSIAGPERQSLEAYFAVDARPSSDMTEQIANKLCLSKSVVRVWYCNQRQKQKRLKNWNDSMTSPN